MISLFFLSCQSTISKQNTDVTDTGEEIQDTALSEPESTSESEEGVNMLVIEQAESTSQLVVRNTANWEAAEIIQETSDDAKLIKKDGYFWLLNHGSDESIIQFDPENISQPKASFQLLEAQQYPSDVCICKDKVFVSLYQGTDILILDPSTLTLLDRMSLNDYADSDGKAEPASLLCKKDFLYVSLHRLNQNPDPNSSDPQQEGSIWVVFDPDTGEEIKQFPDQGFKSQMIDVPNTNYLGSVIKPHIDVSGTPGFWVYDPVADWFYSQIYFAYNDKTIFDTAVGLERAVHLAYNYSDNATWLFCHDFTPGEDQPPYTYSELVPQVHAFVSVALENEETAWIAYKSINSSEEYFFMSVQTGNCMANNDEHISVNPITDWEVLR